MTDKKLKQALKSVYQPPESQKKTAFLDSIEVSTLTMPEFVRSQFGYIRPWGWLTSIGVFVAALLLMWNADGQCVWMISALIPFAALSTFMEMNRSVRCGMDELEQASRFSLKAVTLARLGILGAANVILIAVLSPLIGIWGQLTILETGFYILCPYCLTAFCNLHIIRKWHSKENLYPCAAVTMLVSLLCIIVNFMTDWLSWTSSWQSCAVITLLLLALMLRECKNYLSHMEEYIWN